MMRQSIHVWRGFVRWQGEWYKNKFQGRGKYTWPSRAHYVGDWVDNKCAPRVFRRAVRSFALCTLVATSGSANPSRMPMTSNAVSFFQLRGLRVQDAWARGVHRSGWA
jgi:hypothetical protein